MPGGADYARQRLEVSDLLCRIADHKLYFGDTERALELATEAYARARNPGILAGPWMAITAYRLAHLLLRGSIARIEPGDGIPIERLKHAHELFDEAATGDIGPLPAIYRLATFHRLQSAGVRPKGSIESTFVDALDELRNWERTRVCRDEEWRRTQLQSGMFNMLELAAYLFDVPYRHRLPLYSLEGSGSLQSPERPFADVADSPAGVPWMLVSHDTRFHTVRYPRELALRELQELGRGNCEPGAILFEFQTAGRGQGLVSRICRVGAPWQSIDPNHLRMLAWILAGTVSTGTDLRQRLGSVNSGPALYRKRKERLARTLGGLCGIPHNEVFEINPATGVPQISSQIDIYGAVETSVVYGR